MRILNDELSSRLKKLKQILSDMESVIIAFSGGVDSTFLLKVAKDTLGDKVLAATATSPTYPQREVDEAKMLAEEIGVRHIVFESNELEIDGFAANTPDRCYYCKTGLFSDLRRMADELRLTHVADGSNTDDEHDYRPGRRAARELGVRSPLSEAGFSKEEIRLASREMGLSTWNKPSFACLSSRFPYGTEITLDKLSLVGKCEEFLRELGFSQIRVRYHGDTARIEVPDKEIALLFRKDVKEKILRYFKESGFTYVAADMEGYRTGSMNEGKMMPARNISAPAM